jgi:transcription initiation factor TFIIIB Brf1 subunit/transcription initiation factor TFIIB
MGFSRDVIVKADYYYQKVTQGDIKRSALRKGIIFSCVLFAYKHYKMRITTDELDEIFKIGRKNMSKGLTYFKTNIPKNEIDYDNEMQSSEIVSPDIDKLNDYLDQTNINFKNIREIEYP